MSQQYNIRWQTHKPHGYEKEAQLSKPGIQNVGEQHPM
jgi:hypothetical protein